MICHQQDIILYIKRTGGGGGGGEQDKHFKINQMQRFEFTCKYLERE